MRFASWSRTKDYHPDAHLCDYLLEKYGVVVKELADGGNTTETILGDGNRGQEGVVLVNGTSKTNA